MTFSSLNSYTLDHKVSLLYNPCQFNISMNLIGLPICLAKTQGIEPLYLRPIRRFLLISICNFERLLSLKAGANIQRFFLINQTFLKKNLVYF